MIARYGAVAVAAAAAAGVVIWRMHMTFGCVEKGTMALVARSYGAGDTDRLARAVAQSFLVAGIIGVFMAVITLIFAPYLLVGLQAEAEVVRVGIPFLVIIGMASVPRMFFAVASASLRATGNTKSPMWITLWMNILNILLNFPLIYGIPAMPSLGFGGWAGLGLTGSGISTAIALLFAAVVAGYLMLSAKGQFRLQRHHFVPHRATLRSLLKVSYPAFIEEAIISFGFILFFRLIAGFGTDAVAAHSIATRIEALSFMAGFGFSIAAAALVGQSLGRKDVDLARMAFRISTKYCVALMSVVAVGLILAAGPVVRLFAPDNKNISDMAAMLLIIAAVAQPMMGVAMSLGGGLRGAGDTVTPMISTIVCNVGIRVGASWFFAYPMGYGIYGVYLGTLVDWSARSVFLYSFYRWERWARLRL